MLVLSPSATRILNAVLYRSVLIVQAVKRVHQPVRRPVQKPTWRPHISPPIIGLGVLRGFPDKSTVRWPRPWHKIELFFWPDKNYSALPF